MSPLGAKQLFMNLIHIFRYVHHTFFLITAVHNVKPCIGCFGLVLYKMVQNGHKTHLLWYKSLKQRRKVLSLCVCRVCAPWFCFTWDTINTLKKRNERTARHRVLPPARMASERKPCLRASAAPRRCPTPGPGSPSCTRRRCT